MIIRPADREDIPAIAQIHIEGWQAAYAGVVPQDYLAGLSLEERIAQWNSWFDPAGRPVLVGCDATGAPTGFVNFGKLQTPPPGSSPIRPLYSGEIYALYLLPDYYRQGIGSALLCAAAAGLAAMKHKSLCLWVAEKNERAVSFYKKMGGARCGKKESAIGPATVREICFGWRDTSSLLQPSY